MIDFRAPLYGVQEPLLLVGDAPVDVVLMKRLAVDRPLVAADSGANTGCSIERYVLTTGLWGIVLKKSGRILGADLR
ncbi:MAG: hypothetical protein ACR2RF_24220 [Geminicoccaceae bacterium]